MRRTGKGRTNTILFLGAVPSDTTRVDIGDEARSIHKGLRVAESHGAVAFKQAFAARVDDLRERIIEVRPTVVHFGGHGQAETGRPPGPRARRGRSTSRDFLPSKKSDSVTGTAAILVTDRVGRSLPFPAKALEALFRTLRRSAPIRCVVLNACHTRALAKAISKHIDFVIGAEGELDDDVAVAFARGFYHAIGEGETVQQAFELGKSAVESRSLDPGALHLFSREGTDASKAWLVDAAWKGAAPKKTAGFSDAWFEEHVAAAVENAGPRYTRELHVELAIAKIFDGLGRTEAFRERMTGLLREAREAYGWVSPRRLGGGGAASPPSGSQSALKKAMNALFSALSSALSESRSLALVDFASIQKRAHNAQKCLDELLMERRPASEAQRSAAEIASSYDFHLDQLARVLRPLTRIAEKSEFRMANTPALLLVGKAGYGKTHLFCDVARRRVEDGQPTLLFLGQQFKDDEPWAQMLKLLGLSITRDKFLSKLDRAGEERGCRVLLLIDALNESDDRGMWKKHLAGMLKVLAKYPRLGVAVSVRTSYEDLVVPEGLVPGRLVREEHHGFAGHEYQAAESFFAHYRIPRPTIPLLHPEFQSPLFLKLLCRGIRDRVAGANTVQVLGITTVFGFFLEGINKKLSEPDVLNFDPRRNAVAQAAAALASKMATSGRPWLDREDASRIVDAILPPAGGWEKSLLRHLIAEAVVSEDRTPNKNGGWSEIIRFSYERLADHLIAKHLLDKHLDTSDPRGSFAPGQPLGDLVEHRRWSHQGWIEALSIQAPERIQRELLELVPKGALDFTLRRAFLDSLLWRAPDTITAATEACVRKLLLERHDIGLVFDAAITLSMQPGHRYNAAFLHDYLRRLKMPERDAVWSTFLFEQYGQQGAVDRLIAWAWSTEDKSHVGDASVELAAIALSWFLTTSHRYLRDRATKALVALLTPRIQVLRRLLERFSDVDDLYIRERLFAVAYGCAMRSTDKAAVEALAGDVYQQVFAGGSPLPHLLLRDYARGAIEAALHRGASLSIDRRLIEPPYRSTWPSKLPSEQRLKKKYGSLPKTPTPQELGQYFIYSSVMGFSDFARYVIGTNHHRFEWSSRRLGQAPPPRGSSTGSPRRREHRFDLGVAQRWILQRVFDLGWTRELFGEFDRIARFSDDYGRAARKPERIGKKYQWLAYHEFLARVSDNFEFVGGYAGHADDKEYEGPWQLGVRDIDPSCLLRQTFDAKWTAKSGCFWAPLTARSTSSVAGDQEWLASPDDIPPFTPFVGVRDPSDGSRWLVLETMVRSNELASGEREDNPRPRRRDHYYMVKSYLVRKKDIDRAFAWARRKRYMGRWMPESHAMHDVYLGEFCWSPAFAHQNRPYFSHGEWTKPDGLPAEVLVTTDQYRQESSSFDCSIDETVDLLLPACWLAQGMRLRWNGVDGCFFNKSGKLIAYDPSARSHGPSACLVRRDALVRFLEKNDLDIFWTVLGEKMLLGGGGEPDPKRMEISGALRLRQGKLVAAKPVVDYYPSPDKRVRLASAASQRKR